MPFSRTVRSSSSSPGPTDRFEDLKIRDDDRGNLLVINNLSGSEHIEAAHTAEEQFAFAVSVVGSPVEGHVLRFRDTVISESLFLEG